MSLCHVRSAESCRMHSVACRICGVSFRICTCLDRNSGQQYSKVVQCWYGSGPPLMFGLCVSSSGVTAYARCAFDALGQGGVTVVTSGLSGNMEDDWIETECAQGEDLLGCHCHAPWMGCDGATIVNGRCRVYNGGQGGRVYAQALCGYAPKKTSWTSFETQRSGILNGDSVDATCSAGTYLFGCTCHSWWQNCEGAKFLEDQVCRAYNNGGEGGVTATAICLGFPGGATTTTSTTSTTQKGVAPQLEQVKTIIGPKSDSFAGAMSSAPCGSDWSIVGCACWSTDDSCDGAYATGNLCRVTNKAEGTGVTSYAQCSKNIALGPQGTTHELSALSSNAENAFTEVSCAAGKSMTDCNCWSPWEGCDGATVVDGKCRAHAGPTPVGVFAIATCVTMANGFPATTLAVESERSLATAGAIVDAICPTDMLLTGCMCHSFWASCGGYLFTTGGGGATYGNPFQHTCRAQHGGGDGGVMATAICTRPGSPTTTTSTTTTITTTFVGSGMLPEIITVVGVRSAPFDDAWSEATCPGGWTLTGCMCASPGGGVDCDGSFPVMNSCKAFNKQGGAGVIAHARCSRHLKNPGTDVTHVVSQEGGNYDNDFMQVQCPADQVMTGCSCHSQSFGCDGSTVAGPYCRAYKAAAGGTVRAIASCMPISQQIGAGGLASMPSML